MGADILQFAPPPAPQPETPRWEAVIRYRHDAAAPPIIRKLREISELDAIIEQGPHWDTVISIVVRRINHNESPTLTVEAALEL